MKYTKPKQIMHVKYCFKFLDKLITTMDEAKDPYYYYY